VPIARFESLEDRCFSIVASEDTEPKERHYMTRSETDCRSERQHGWMRKSAGILFITVIGELLIAPVVD